MDETFLNRNKNINFIKKTPSLYNFIYLKEIIFLLEKPQNRDIIDTHNKIFDIMNDKFLNSVSKSIIHDQSREYFKNFLKLYYDNVLEADNSEIIELMIEYYFENILKMSIDDYMGDFFSLINNKENLIILPSFYNTEINTLREYFLSINFFKKFFITKSGNKKELSHFNQSNKIQNNPFYKKFIEMIDQYDSSNIKNIVYLSCISETSIKNDELNNNLQQNIDEINKKINDNYDIYMTQYGRKESTSELPPIYKNIYMFFDDENSISLKLLENQRNNNFNNNSSVKFLNEEFLKRIELFDNKNFRRIIIQEQVEKIKIIDVNYYKNDNTYLNNKDINNIYKRIKGNIYDKISFKTNNPNIKNLFTSSASDRIRVYFNKDSKKYSIELNTLIKIIFFYLFFFIKHIRKNDKIEELSKTIDNDYLKKLNIKYYAEIKKPQNENFDIVYVTLPLESTYSRMSYILKFFNHKIVNNIPIYFIKSSGDFKSMYITNETARNIGKLLPEISGKKKTLNKTNYNNDILFILRLIFVFSSKSSTYSTQKQYKNYLLRIKKLIMKNKLLQNINIKHIELLIKIDKIENINSFRLYLRNTKTNNYIELKNYNGYLIEKPSDKEYEVNNFNVSNIVSKYNKDNIFYYNNFLIKPENLKSYLEFNNLSDNLSVELLKILSDSESLNNFYTYNILNEELKSKFIDNKNEVTIINNIIKIIFSKNTPFSTYISKRDFTIKDVFSTDTNLKKYKIENVSTIQNRLYKYPEFIINQKSELYLFKNSKNKVPIKDVNPDIKKFYEDKVFVKNSTNYSYAIIKLDLVENTKINTNDIKNITCKERKSSITEKLKKFFDFGIIKNNITKKRIQYLGIGGKINHD